MSRPRVFTMAALLAVFILLMGGAPLLKGVFNLGKHEGDTIHLAELVLRMAEGQLPHLDFMTPIGILAIAPIAFFVKVGAGLGHAIFLAQMLVAALLAPAVLRVAVSRLTGIWPYAYAFFVMLLCLALVHGEAHAEISISMHYNRWAWAISYIIIPLAVLAPLDRPRPWLDGALIGVGLGVLVMMKVTYFVGFAPGILVALLARRQFSAILSAAIGGLVVAALVTMLAGTEFWLAYLKDLLTVSSSGTRPAPGDSFLNIIGAPAYMGGTMVLVAFVIFLRQGGRSVEGLAALILMPGCFYVVYQNWGNDPQWLYLVAMMAFLLRPEPGVTNGLGWDMRTALSYVGALALALGAASAINLAYSPWRHLASTIENPVPLLPALAVHDDVVTPAKRLYTANARRPFDRDGDPFTSYREFAERDDPVSLNGEVLDECQQEGGISAWFEVVTADLQAAGYGGTAIMGTDLYSAYWMFGDFKTVKGAAPWYYGGLPGVENADYLVVPTCPMAFTLRQAMLRSLEEDGWTLREVYRSELYILVQPVAPTG